MTDTDEMSAPANAASGLADGPWCWRNSHLSTAHGGGKVVMIACCTRDHRHQVALKTRDPKTGVLVPLEPDSHIGRLLATAPVMAKFLFASSQALRSYQFGNGSPDLAKSIADEVDAFLTGLSS
jgi:hypothetical protein